MPSVPSPPQPDHFFRCLRPPLERPRQPPPLQGLPPALPAVARPPPPPRREGPPPTPPPPGPAGSRCTCAGAPASRGRRRPFLRDHPGLPPDGRGGLARGQRPP